MKNASSARHKGYDAGKKVSGIKRHIAVDTQGFPHALTVTTAEVTDRSGGLQAIDRNLKGLDQVHSLLADGGYTGQPFADAVARKLGATVQIAKRNELHSFAVIPQRWIVERSFAWLKQSRRLWKNPERLINTSLQFTVLAFLNLLLKRLWTTSEAAGVFFAPYFSGFDRRLSVSSRVRLLAILGACFFLFSCGKEEPPAPSPPLKIADSSESYQSLYQKSGPIWQRKVNAYINIYNRFMGFNIKMNPGYLDEARKGDFRYISNNSHFFRESVLRRLKQTIQIPGKTPEADVAAKALLGAAEKYVPGWLELEEYNKTRGYDEDGGTKGRALLPQYIEGQIVLRQAVADFMVQVQALSSQAKERRVTEFRTKGLLLEAHAVEAMGHSEKLRALFLHVDDLKDKKKILEADAHLAAMEKSVADMLEEYKKRKEKGDPEKDSVYQILSSGLMAVGASYHEARKNPKELMLMAGLYTNLVEEVNWQVEFHNWQDELLFSKSRLK